jgi:hypothetical protein
MIVKDQTDVEVGIYHSGYFRVLLTRYEASLYKMACELFLYEFEFMDKISSKEDWKDRELLLFDASSHPNLGNAEEVDSTDPVFIPNFSIKKLGKVSLGDHNNLPDSPGIYFAIDSASRVWYVGISTSSLRQRHSQHEKQQQFKKNKVQHIAYFVWNDEQDLNEWEFGYIQKFDPPLNMNLTQKDLPQINLGYNEEHFVSRYKEIKQQIALLSLELEELKPNLVTLLEVNGGKLKTSDFSGYTQSRRSWQYSKEIETKKQEIKLLEEQEVKSGVATVKSLTTYPVFRFR